MSAVPRRHAAAVAAFSAGLGSRHVGAGKGGMTAVAAGSTEVAGAVSAILGLRCGRAEEIPRP